VTLTEEHEVSYDNDEQGLATRRRFRTDLLPRPPCVAPLYEDRWAALVVDATDQLSVLSDLLAQGLLTAEEYEWQKAKVLRR
jgi:hypothetical protein